MSQKNFMLLINIPIILITFLLGFFLPDLSKPTVLFGINIRAYKFNIPLIKRIKNTYKKIYILLCGSCTILLIYIFCSFTQYYILLLGLIILIITMNFTYSIMYKKIRNLDSLKDKSTIGTNIIISDVENYPAKNNTISSELFLIPICISILDLVVSLTIYPSLPKNLFISNILKVKSSIQLQKSIKLIIKLPVMEGILTILLYIAYKFIFKIKLSYKNINAELCQKKNRVFCTLWSFFTIICNIILNLIMMISHFNTLTIISSSSMRILNTILVCILFLILILTIVFTTKSHLNIKLLKYFNTDMQLKTLIDRNDDAYWKFWNCYFNPNDPKIFINKRTGTGKCLNFGRLASYIIISVPVSIFIVILSFLIIYKI